ncbi:MAG: alpha/beta fold hydrolase [Ideonella sp.]|nr:alpha/beta fold hydrolase [Ideonella sp.]
MTKPYVARRIATNRQLSLRGLNHHLTVWGDLATATQPVLWMMHGFMDVGASFQFVVDAMADGRCIVAPDWRGFGLTRAPHGTDSYWFPDYLGDLDALLDAVVPGQAADLLGHSMGGNVVMAYAAIRPERVRRLINLEGFGLPDGKPEEAPARLTRWLDQLRTPATLKPYARLADVAARLQQNNPRLPSDKAAWLAAHWASRGGDGQWHLRADPAHKRVNPVLAKAAEAVALWSRIRAPLLWVDAVGSRLDAHWGGRYTLAEFNARLAQVPQVQRVSLDDAGHMLHHDQPEALAHALEAFLDAA